MTTELIGVPAAACAAVVPVGQTSTRTEPAAGTGSPASFTPLWLRSIQLDPEMIEAARTVWVSVEL